MNKEKGRKYHHINKGERLEISILLKRGYGVREIAKALKRSPGSISGEISNNSVREVYDPHKAQHKAYVKRKYSKYQGMKIVGNGRLRSYVEEKAKKDWSPDEIAGRLRNIDKDISYVSRQGIYKFIHSPYGRQLEPHLRYYKRKKGKKREKLTQLQNRTFIDKRPGTIDKKTRYGDWEGDLIVSGKDGEGVLLVLYERKAMYTLIQKINSRKPDVINDCLSGMIQGLIWFNSLTIDNDISFQKHKELSLLLGTDIYFCHPYHSWEKGGVENANLLIRQYVPKGSDISKYSDRYIREIQDKLNNRPRKSLGYKTPLEVMRENNQFKTLENLGIIEEIKNKPCVRLEG